MASLVPIIDESSILSAKDQRWQKCKLRNINLRLESD